MRTGRFGDHCAAAGRPGGQGSCGDQPSDELDVSRSVRVRDRGLRLAVCLAPGRRPSIQNAHELRLGSPELGAEVLSGIRELAEEGMTMLIVTHEMGFAREVAKRVCFLHEGVILEEGTPEEIFGAPREPRTQQFLQRIVDAGRL